MDRPRHAAVPGVARPRLRIRVPPVITTKKMAMPHAITASVVIQSTTMCQAGNVNR